MLPLSIDIHTSVLVQLVILSLQYYIECINSSMCSQLYNHIHHARLDISPQYLLFLIL